VALSGDVACGISRRSGAQPTTQGAIRSAPRPYFEHPLVLEASYSFPSGHATMSLVSYGMLAYFCVLALRTWRARTALVFGAAPLVLLISFSRMYLGVHYFSDVVAGFASGGI